MTPSEFAIEIRRKIEALRRDNFPLNYAAADTHTKMTTRIFVDGKARNESNIGTYSTKPIYLKQLKDPDGGFSKDPKPYGIEPRNDNGFYPKRGKNGNTEFKTTKRPRITSYFEGWKGFRSVQGLQTAKVDLNYTGEMFKDFGKTNLPFLEKVEQLNLNEYASTFTKEINTIKAKGNEEHFRKSIFELSESEKDNFYRVLELKLKELLEI